MAFKILTKKSVEHSNIDGARQNYFMSGMRDGIIKGSLNEGELFASASNVIAFDSCVLLIGGHEVIIDATEYITINDYPSVNTRLSLVAEINVSSDGDPSFRIYTQSASTALVQEELYDTLSGEGTYQIEIGQFTITTLGKIEKVERCIDLISGGSDIIGIDKVSAETLEPSENASVAVSLKQKDKNKNYFDFLFKIPRGKTGATGPIGPQGPRGDNGLASGAILSNIAGVSDINGYTQQAVNNLISNPNLLINGDFRVNQRGQTSYTAPTNSNKTYCVDRFYLNWATSLTSINNNSITLQFNRQYAVFGQVVEDFNKYKDKTLTLSVKVSNVSTPRNLYLRYDDGVVQQSTLINGNGVFTKTFTISDNASLLSCTIFNTNATGTPITLDVEYMKLEIGSVATAFSPRPYAEELAICQRYYQILEMHNTVYCSYEKGLGVPINLTAPLRTTPTIEMHVEPVFGGNGEEVEGIVNSYVVDEDEVSDNIIIVGLYVNWTLQEGSFYTVRNGTFLLDAEIY